MGQLFSKKSSDSPTAENSSPIMADRKIVSTKTKVDTKEETKEDGTVVKTITTTTTEGYADGSEAVKTQVQTITTGKAKRVTKTEDGKEIIIPDDAKEKATKAEVTTSDSFIKEALQAHNSLRAKHAAGPLTLNPELCKVAQAWANKLAEQDSMEHSSWGYGENVFWASYDVNDGKVAVEKWYSEIEMFNFKNIDHQRGTGHFTQVVWKGSKELGIAKALSKKGGTYVVANYDPPGNFLKQYPENISPPKN